MPYANMPGSLTRPTAQNYHALFFVGVCNVERYPRSLVRWTNLLHDMYGYPIGNIRILVGAYGSGTWPSMEVGTDTTYNATQANLDQALADYAPGGTYALGPSDNLFIFTFNHGGNDSDGLGSYLCCENFATKYYASAFATRISAIGCRQIVLLAAQCYAGGFVDPVMNALIATNKRGAVLAGCRSDQTTMEAVCDKLVATALNGRMVLNALDDNIDLGITGDGVDVYLVPGYNTDRVDWGPTGVMSMREAYDQVYHHYYDHVWPTYPWISEIPLYRQTPWYEAGQLAHIRLGEPDLVIRDYDTDTGVEPSTGSPWYSPDLYADNTDLFPTTGQHEYVPQHHNRFFNRISNRGTAPTDDIWRFLEVRGLGFSGGQVGPPSLHRITETSLTPPVTVSARLRPTRAHTQYDRILIGGDFGHGCVSAATFAGCDPMSHTLWHIPEDNDQAQCNLDPAAVSGSTPVGGGATNSNAGKLIRTIPVEADEDGTFEVKVMGFDGEVKGETAVEPATRTLKKGDRADFNVTITIPSGTKDGAAGRLTVVLVKNQRTVGGVTFLLKVATSHVMAYVYDAAGLAVPKAKVTLTAPQDPRRLEAFTDEKGLARFGPLNPGFYFAHTEGLDEPPVRVHAAPGKEVQLRLRLHMGKPAVLGPQVPKPPTVRKPG